jgi:hypothetical protein
LDSDGRHDERYLGIQPRYAGSKGLYQGAYNLLKAAAPLSMDQLDRLGLFKDTGQLSHRKRELVYHAL